MEVEILTTAVELESFQSALYRRFEGNYNQDILKVFYDILPGRLVPKVKQEDCLFYGCKVDGRVMAGMAAHVGGAPLMERFGFKVEESRPFCEGFAIFGSDALKDNFFDYLYRLARYYLWDLHEKGYDILYYCSTKRLEAMFSFMGCDTVDSLTFEGERISLMRLDIVQCLKDKCEISAL